MKNCLALPPLAPLWIAPQLPTEELGRRYRQATDGVEHSHYPMIWRLVQGHPTAEVAELTGYSRGWIDEWIWSDNRR